MYMYMYMYIFIFQIGRHIPVCGYVCVCVWAMRVTSAGRRYGKHPPRHAIAPGLRRRAWLR